MEPGVIMVMDLPCFRPFIHEDPDSLELPSKIVQGGLPQLRTGTTASSPLLPTTLMTPSQSLLLETSPWMAQSSSSSESSESRLAIQNSQFSNVGRDMNSSTVNDHSHHERVENTFHTNINYNVYLQWG